VPNPSAVVAQEVGTPSVAEAAALLAAQQMSQMAIDPVLRINQIKSINLRTLTY
jgi:cobalt-precorrin 5A hydrolase/precorrin-3B C17-methyltransferase